MPIPVRQFVSDSIEILFPQTSRPFDDCVEYHTGIPDFHVVSETASTAREFDSSRSTPGLTRIISPGRPARTRAASHSEPHPWRGP